MEWVVKVVQAVEGKAASLREARPHPEGITLFFTGRSDALALVTEKEMTLPDGEVITFVQKWRDEPVAPQATKVRLYGLPPGWLPMAVYIRLQEVCGVKPRHVTPVTVPNSKVLLGSCALAWIPKPHKPLPATLMILGRTVRVVLPDAPRPAQDGATTATPQPQPPVSPEVVIPPSVTSSTTTPAAEPLLPEAPAPAPAAPAPADPAQPPSPTVTEAAWLDAEDLNRAHRKTARSRRSSGASNDDAPPPQAKRPNSLPSPPSGSPPPASLSAEVADAMEL
jgi:hypothetical protein